MAHTFNPRTREERQADFLSLRPAWSAERVPEQPRLLHRETLGNRIKTKPNKKPGVTLTSLPALRGRERRITGLSVTLNTLSTLQCCEHQVTEEFASNKTVDRQHLRNKQGSTMDSTHMYYLEHTHTNNKSISFFSHTKFV